MSDHQADALRHAMYTARPEIVEGVRKMWDDVDLSAEKIVGYVQVPTGLMRDRLDIGAIISREMARSYALQKRVDAWEALREKHRR